MKNVRPKISIVIPVYNAENCLRRCYESLASQTLRDSEIVFVNDGSADSSLEMLNRFAREDSRVKVLCQENQGTLLARKNGVAATTGDWCLFVDPDDWLEPTACQTLLERTDDSVDVISFGAVVEGGTAEDRVTIDGMTQWLNRKACRFSGEELTTRIFVDDAAPANIWGKLIRGDVCRRAFAGQRDVVATFAEDQYAFFCVAQEAHRRMRLVEDRLYHYQFGDGIATRKEMSEASFRKVLNAVLLADDLATRFPGEAAAHFRRRVLSNVYDAVRQKIDAGRQHDALAELYRSCSKEEVREAVLSFGRSDGVVDMPWIEKAAPLFSDVPVSVVIPVYNVEKYLRECLDSVLAQSHPNIEIICVNDGSTDSSRKILDEYPRVQIIDQENAGLGAARNVGLAAATGKYVYFLDSDDKIVPEAIACLTALAERENLDQIVFEAEPFADSGDVDARDLLEERRYQTIHPSLCDRVMSGPEFLTRSLPLDLTVSQPVRFFRRVFLTENAMRYPEGTLHEDNVVAWTSAYLSQRICAIDRRYFLRRVHGGSIMHTSDNSMRRADGCLRNIEMALAFKPFWTTDPELRQHVLRYCIAPLCVNASRLSGLDLRLTASPEPVQMSVGVALSYVIESMLPWGLVLAWKKVFHRPLPQQEVFTRRFRHLKYLFPAGFIRYWARRTYGESYD